MNVVVATSLGPPSDYSRVCVLVVCVTLLRDIAVSVLNPGYVRTGIASKSEGQQQAVVSELRASLTPAQQELYPGLFDAEKRKIHCNSECCSRRIDFGSLKCGLAGARLRAKALKAFENAVRE